MNISTLHQLLAEKIQQLYKQYHTQPILKVYSKFDRTLFSEDFQSFEFYFQEIQHTLMQLESLNVEKLEQAQFYAERLLAQCTALTDALKEMQQLQVEQAKPPAQSSSDTISEREKIKHAIHQLPPRERLDKYYEALQALNNKIELYQDLYSQAIAEHKSYYQQRIEVTKQRRARCLEAIDVLEEYLAFKAENI